MEVDVNAERAELLARRFHEAYERLAPSHGYKTRTESAVPWEQVPENNRKLMIAVAAEVGSLVDSRQFYCDDCDEFQDVTWDWCDVVCPHRHIIATFRAKAQP